MYRWNKQPDGTVYYQYGNERPVGKVKAFNDVYLASYCAPNMEDPIRPAYPFSTEEDAKKWVKERWAMDNLEEELYLDYSDLCASILMHLNAGVELSPAACSFIREFQQDRSVRREFLNHVIWELVDDDDMAILRFMVNF